MNNWFDHILYNTRAQPETPAVVMEDRVVTYGMLGIAIANCARRIHDLGVPRDGLVAVIVNSPIRQMTLGLAAHRIGVRSMAILPGQPTIADLKFDAVLSDRDIKSWLNPANNFVVVDDAWFGMTPLSGPELPPPFPAEEHVVCRRSLTSGSTGEPKIIDSTIGYIGRHVVPGITIFNCGRVLAMPGLTSIFGYMVACAVLASRKTLCFAESPFQAIRMIELFAIDFILAATDQLVPLSRAARKMGAQVRSLRTVAAGGSIPTRALAEGAATYLCKNLRFRYGTSEVGLLAETTAAEVLSKPGFVGYVHPGFDIGVFAPDGRALPVRELGIVKARVKRESGEEEAWTDHGDIGWITADGGLFIVGRTADIDDLSDASVRDISPVHEVEHLLRLEWDASDAAAVLIDNGGKPEIWVGTVDCKDADAKTLETILRQRGIPGAVRLFALQAVPRGANGKVQRGQLKSLMLNAAALSKF